MHFGFCWRTVKLESVTPNVGDERQLEARVVRRKLSARSTGWASYLQRHQEFLWRYLSLPQDASERADLDLFVHGNHAALGLALHDDVAAALTNLCET